jgi:hypothetical protein
MASRSWQVAGAVDLPHPVSSDTSSVPGAKRAPDGSRAGAGGESDVRVGSSSQCMMCDECTAQRR